MNPTLLLITGGAALLVSGIALLNEKSQKQEVLTKKPEIDIVDTSNANSVPCQNENLQDETSNNLDSDRTDDGNTV